MKYRHKKTGDYAEISNNDYYHLQADGRSIPKRFIENSCDWELIIEDEIPIGTIVRDMLSYNQKYIKDDDTKWYAFGYTVKDTLIKPSEIGKGKRYQIVEEKQESDYFVISSFKHKKEGTITSFSKPFDNGYLINWLEYNDIYSVKRIKDEEIFTICDKITGTLSEDEVKNGFVPITGFEINDREIIINISTGKIVCNRKDRDEKCNQFFTISKYKETPIFTTEDGEAIRSEDDIFYIVEKESLRFVGAKKVRDLSNPNIAVWDGSDGYLQFWKIDAANEYIIKHSKLICLQDILNDCNHFNISTSLIYKNLKKLVEERIKNK